MENQKPAEEVTRTKTHAQVNTSQLEILKQYVTQLEVSNYYRKILRSSSMRFQGYNCVNF